MELYHFVKKLYESCELKSEINFEKFIEEFMRGTFFTGIQRKAIWFDDDFLDTFIIDYEVDHGKQKILLSLNWWYKYSECGKEVIECTEK